MALIPDYPPLGTLSEDTLFIVDTGIQTYSLKLEVLALHLKNMLIEPGTIDEWGGPPETIPEGWSYCDGGLLLRAEYPRLFANIGTAHGAGDGVTTFAKPDKRGRFNRGMNSGSGRDPNASTRTAPAAGGNTGDAVGSIQGHAFQTHNHTQVGHSHEWKRPDNAGNLTSEMVIGNAVNRWRWSPTSAIQTVAPVINDRAAYGSNSQATPNETRPLNVNVVYMIKL